MKTTEQDRYGAVEKCRAVLAVWTERKTAAVLCREMGMSAALFSQWQDRALSGIVEALEPRGTREGSEGPTLSEQMQRLLDRKIRAKELEVLGRSASWRGRAMKKKPIQETPSPNADSVRR